MSSFIWLTPQEKFTVNEVNSILSTQGLVAVVATQEQSTLFKVDFIIKGKLS